MDEEVGVTQERSLATVRAPIRSIDTFESTARNHKRSCMTGMHIIDPKNEMIQNQRVVKNE